MVFFQAMLLGGYLYAHFIARYLPLKGQAVLHIALLAVFTVMLPLAIPADTTPPAGSGQAFWQLGIMLTYIGGPFFILAASAPLFQHWFSASGHKDAENPYFLYAISNAGSMGALLLYPLLAEPLLTLHEQGMGWFAGYIILIALTCGCAILVRNGQKPRISYSSNQGAVTWRSRLIWIALAFIPSSLMLGVTTMITTDIASAPMIWIIPLAIYLATFIIAFAQKPLWHIGLTRELTAYMLCLSIMMFMISAFLILKVVMIVAHLVTFFLCALLCHQELSRLKPSASRLTEYFLLISFGGVLGGIFNALVAPLILTSAIEYALVLALIPFVIWIAVAQKPVITGEFNKAEDSLRPLKLRLMNFLMAGVGIALCAATYFIENTILQLVFSLAIGCYLFMNTQNRLVFAVVCAVALACFSGGFWNKDFNLLIQDRNYFGVVRVYQKDNINYLYHGTTLHGAQMKGEDELAPTTYYSPGSPASDAFEIIAKDGAKKNIAALGLGVGSISCYAEKGQILDFFEIDEDIVNIAKDPVYFSYISKCAPQANIILGDGRLKIAEKPDGAYDILFLDAFSSDNIPVHLITKEAIEIYLRKLSEDGFIVINISNRYLDLRPMLSSQADELGLTFFYKTHKPIIEKGGVSELYTDSFYAVLAKKPETIAPLVEENEWIPYTGKRKVRGWTDDYANILTSLMMFQ